MLFFHGNAEDVGMSYQFLDHLRSVFELNILAMEYPGYGIYTQHEPSESRILSDAETVYKFLINHEVDPKDIVLFGRSIGSGSATHLAS